MSERDRLIKIVAEEILKQWQRLYPMQEYVDQISAVRRMGDELVQLRADARLRNSAISA